MNSLPLMTNNVWMMVCTALVFLMHLGFTLLEIGLTRQKNTINVLFKNVFILSISLILYALIGFNLMYPGDFNGFLGFTGLGLDPPIVEGKLNLSYSNNYTYWTNFLFQGMFAATAVTIVSGAVAERIQLRSFILFSIFYVGLIYPIVGSWQWGGGFLEKLGFYDFAGSTIVHSVGGWGALVAVWLLGARIGKYEKGKVFAIAGHNIPYATFGVFILWFGWFGFNGGSVLSADPEVASLSIVTTCLAASSAGLSSFIISSVFFKTYDITMFLNGILGGLVAITAGADQMSIEDAILIGIIAGIIIVVAITLIDNTLRLDDPVGAIAVHLVCGIFGTLAVGIFGEKAGWDQLTVQFIGIASVGLFCVLSAFLILFLLKKTLGIRVSEQQEIEGLDIHEHAMDAYPDFRMNDH